MCSSVALISAVRINRVFHNNSMFLCPDLDIEYCVNCLSFVEVLFKFVDALSGKIGKR
jgi:hypothetical protein